MLKIGYLWIVVQLYLCNSRLLHGAFMNEKFKKIKIYQFIEGKTFCDPCLLPYAMSSFRNGVYSQRKEPCKSWLRSMTHVFFLNVISAFEVTLRDLIFRFEILSY